MTTDDPALVARDLVRDLVLTYIDHPDDLTVETKEVPGALYFKVKGHADDYGKLVGKGGAHVTSLKIIVSLMGEAVGMLYSFKLDEPDPGERRPMRAMAYAKTFDPEPSRELLDRLMAALPVGDFVVDVKQTGRGPLAFTFTISVRDAADYMLMTVAPEDMNPRITAVGAIGTLFRAAANKAGVKFQITAAKS